MTDDALALIGIGFCAGGIATVLGLLALAQIAAWIAPRRDLDDGGECPVLPLDKMRHRRNLRRWGR